MLTPFQWVSLISALIEYGYKAYLFILGIIDQAEFEATKVKLHACVDQIKQARTPKELQDAARDKARLNHDISGL